ncbi:MAG TPA: hypothetical protein V6C72_06485 [Chroococcales cyanobacterium]
MADAGANLPGSGNYGSPEQLMFEALDKASNELDKFVKTCIEHLTSATETMERSLSSQLAKVVEQSKNFVDSNAEDLTAHREEAIDRLNEFERTEIETMVSAAREVRQQVAGRAHQASESIARLVEEQLAELRSLIENPESRFANFADRNTQDLEKITSQSKSSLDASESEHEHFLTETATELDGKVRDAIAGAKSDIEKTLEKHNSAMEEKIANVIAQLSEVVGTTLEDLAGSSREGSGTVELAGIAGKEKLNKDLEAWNNECTDLSNSFKEGITQDRDEAEKRQSSKLERKVAEVKDEIDHISQDANAKVSASHKLFLSSLKRLEKKYNDRLERLLVKFNQAVSEESKISGESVQSSSELKDLLHARLQARATEISKGFRRQVDLMESEFMRASANSNERIEHVRATATEGLDKEARELKISLEAITRKFHTDLGGLQPKLNQIEEQGRAVALAVMTYRSAMNSYERE